LYIVGVACKFGLVGPDWLRFHLSDVGFPLVIALLLWGMYKKKYSGMSMSTMTERFKLELQIIHVYMMYAVTGFVISVLYEVVTGIMVTALAANAKPVGDGRVAESRRKRRKVPLLQGGAVLLFMVFYRIFLPGS
jgi:hypothetical protein